MGRKKKRKRPQREQPAPEQSSTTHFHGDVGLVFVRIDGGWRVTAFQNDRLVWHVDVAEKVPTVVVLAVDGHPALTISGGNSPTLAECNADGSEHRVLFGPAVAEPLDQLLNLN